ESLRRIEERFRRSERPMPANNRKQALLPEGSTPIPNPLGTAPGFICPVERGGTVRHVACLPGVPHEMRRMVEEVLVPWVRARQPGRRFASRVFSTFGLTESALDELLAGAVRPDEARLAFRAAFPRLQARVTVSGGPEEDLEGRLDQLERRARERLGTHICAIGEEAMEEPVGRRPRGAGRTAAVAESRAGGRVRARS